MKTSPKSPIRSAIVAALLLAAGAASATNNVQGTVLTVGLSSFSGVVTVKLTNMVGAPAGCASQGKFAITNETVEAGKKMFAQLLAARATQSTILIYGAGVCTRTSVAEDIDSVDF